MKKSKKLLVVKLGSGLLADARGGVNHARIGEIVRQAAALKKLGYQVIMVSSGAISAGMTALKLDKRPKDISELQVCATIGQPRLMLAYQDAFSKYNLHAAQILMTTWDLDSRKIYENAKCTVSKLLKLKNCVPIFNENDAVSFDEIAFGDNDILSAHVAMLSGASKLIILTSVDGLRSDPSGRRGRFIRYVKKITPQIESYAGQTKSIRSLGGMISKIQAAKMATEKGIPVVIANGKSQDILLKVVRGKFKGTLFAA